MLIILETSHREHLMRQCYDMLSSVLTAEHLLDWGLHASDPVVVSRQMIDWAMGGDIAVQTEWREYADNSGDEPGRGGTLCESGDLAAG